MGPWRYLFGLCWFLQVHFARSAVPLLANSDFFSLNPTQTTITLERPFCMFKDAIDVYLFAIVKGATNIQVADAAKKVIASNYTGTQGGLLGPYQVAKLDNPKCENIQASNIMADPNKYIVRVGGDVNCLTDPNFKGICNPPLQNNLQYRFTYVFTIGDVVQYQTDWSPPISTVNVKSSGTIDTWPGRRSGGMIVLTSILSTLMFFVFFAYIVGFAYSILNGSQTKEVSRHDTQTTAVLQKAQEPGDITYSSTLAGSERYAATQQA
ncbi:uroplakin 3A L homeolog precursor [Xenopus laevis]|uniref:LOC398743 protein n=2 Tax=Xenopus laevis TaxID=8355 RepID=Q75W53_XENLA|nr:uroplakin 3A L homeolog precursor [Xenopus laevis]AAH73184.1 LOC398743 protein [Xenopus laevis]OCT88039.1 hypothetical protein XELAEV_18016668mg [Xenopus laevis]BAC99015.1 uroplakin III [Xenopus laevis]